MRSLAFPRTEAFDLLLRQIAEFHPKAVAVVDKAAAQKVKSELQGMSQPPLLLEGPQGLTELAAMPGADVCTECSGRNCGSCILAGCN